jgi:CRISPR-associated endonuclease Csn1
LACNNCNQEKGNRIPFAAFGTDEDRWAQILQRVKSWGNQDKLDRFYIKDLTELDPDREESWAQRRLNDTRYTSKLAARYLGFLYGGRDQRMPDGRTKRRVFASSGMLTASLRRAWQLESILREADPPETSRKPGKPRSDHRHHAIDAITIALTSNAVVQRASAVAASANYAAAERTVLNVPQPWIDFVPSIRPLIERMIVSHRPSHKLLGPLHEDTNYSAPREIVIRDTEGKKRKKPKTKTVVHVRKFVWKVDPEDIVDVAVQAAVKETLAALGGKKEALEHDPPMLHTRTGKQVPIYRVRVRTSTPVSRISSGERERYVASAGNHHIAIFETVDKKGQRVWESPGVVSRLDAVLAKGPKHPKGTKFDLIRKQLPEAEDARFLFSLMIGDMVEMMDRTSGQRDYYTVSSISEGEYVFLRHSKVVPSATSLGLTLPQLRKSLQDRGDRLRIGSIDDLRLRDCRKVFVDVLGKVRV